jgi:EF hand
MKSRPALLATTFICALSVLALAPCTPATAQDAPAPPVPVNPVIPVKPAAPTPAVSTPPAPKPVGAAKAPLVKSAEQAKNDIAQPSPNQPLGSSGFAPPQPRADGDKAQCATFSCVDINRDSRLTRDELDLAGDASLQLESLDNDRNGHIDQEEWERFERDHPSSRRLDSEEDE